MEFLILDPSAPVLRFRLSDLRKELKSWRLSKLMWAT